MAATALRACRDDVPALVRDCPSGREHLGTDREPDVDFSSRIDAYDVVVRLRDGWLTA